MDGDSYKRKIKIDEEEVLPKEATKNNVSNTCDILQSPRVRRFICFSNEVDELVLDNRFNFLFHVSPIFWIIFFIRSM
jgi:hypothetical protein